MIHSFVLVAEVMILNSVLYCQSLMNSGNLFIHSNPFVAYKVDFYPYLPGIWVFWKLKYSGDLEVFHQL